jgi:negative regulator of flagellin synthesis FlgM
VKIENSVKSLGGNGIASSRTTAKGGGDKSVKADGVNVQLSSLSSQLQSIGNNLASSGSVVDTAQVADIKQAIAEGRFTINPEVIADRLLESVKELISSSRN